MQISLVGVTEQGEGEEGRGEIESDHLSCLTLTPYKATVCNFVLADTELLVGPVVYSRRVSDF